MIGLTRLMEIVGAVKKLPRYGSNYEVVVGVGAKLNTKWRKPREISWLFAFNEWPVSFNELPVSFNELSEIEWDWLKLAEIGTNWRKSGEIGENWQKLVEVDENCEKLTEIGRNWLRIAEKWWKGKKSGENSLTPLTSWWKWFAPLRNWPKLMKIGQNLWKLELKEKRKFVYMHFFLPISCASKYVHRHAKN